MVHQWSCLKPLHLCNKDKWPLHLLHRICFFFFKRTYSTVKGFPCLTSQFKSSKAEKPLFQSIRSDGPKVQYEIWTLMFVLCHSNYLFMWQHLIEREEHFKGSHAPAAFQAHKQTVFNNGWNSLQFFLLKYFKN